MVSRASHGSGSIYRRKDGRFQVAVRMRLPDGTSKRTYTTCKTRRAADEILHDKLAKVRNNIPISPERWTVGSYLDHWMKDVVAVNRRANTVTLYDMYIRLYLKPTLGKRPLASLSVNDVQSLLNQVLATKSVRLAHGVRSTLRAALHRAMREELLIRNVASLTELPAWQRKRITPWNPEQSNAFLRASERQNHQWHLAYLMLLTYGMRRGEVLGLRWSDIDLERGTIQIEQQLQRIGSELVTGPVKTEAGRRTLPVVPLMRQAILDHLEKATGQVPSPSILQQLVSDEALVFTSSVGTPVDPKNFVRAFHLLRDKAGLPRITVHHLRHTAATMLKNLGVPARDAQLILGHAQITTTQQLYQHGDIEGQRRALALMERQMLTVTDSSNGGQIGGQTEKLAEKIDEFGLNNLGGPGGTRTHDTLLKRPLEDALNNLPTPVLRHVQALTRAYKIGAVVVKIGGQPRPSTSLLTRNFIADLKNLANPERTDGHV